MRTVAEALHLHPHEKSSKIPFFFSVKESKCSPSDCGLLCYHFTFMLFLSLHVDDEA